MPTAAEVAQADRDAELEARVQALESLLAQYSNNGLKDMLIGHGYQEFGGPVGRLDDHGIQIVKTSNPTAGSRGFTAVFFVPKRSIEPGYESDRAYVDGLAIAGGDTIAALTAVSGASAVDGTGGTTPGVFVTANNTTGDRYVRIRYTDILEAISADPAVFEDGMRWYRGDTDKFRGRANGATDNFAMEAWVTANGATVKSPVMITPLSRNAMSEFASSVFSATAWGSATWPAANRAIAYPFTLDESTTIVKLWCYNGAAVSGNVDLGIYDENWVRKVSMGSTAQAGTDIIQEFNVADTPLDAGRYYMALCCDNTTAAFRRTLTTGGAQSLKVVGMAQQAVGAVTLPDPFVPAVVATDYTPFFGASLRTLVA